MADVERTLGEHTEAIRTIREDVAEVKSDVKLILATLHQAKGAAWAGKLVAGTVGGVVAWLASIFTK